MRIALIIGYLLLTAIGSITSEISFNKLALISLFTGLLLSQLRTFHWLSWLVFLGACGLLFWTSSATYFAYFPLLIATGLPLLISSVFIRSLLPGNTPLVSYIAEKARGTLAQPIQKYTHISTIIWPALLILLALESLLLWFLASHDTWVLFTHFINYIIIGVLFVIEYLCINIFLRDYEHPSFIDYIKVISKNIKPND